jgi:hypothetical protein
MRSTACSLATTRLIVIRKGSEVSVEEMESSRRKFIRRLLRNLWAEQRDVDGT